MNLEFKDILNRPLIMAGEVAVFVTGIIGLLSIKFYKLSNMESLFILPVFVLQLYLLKELEYRMNLEVTDAGLSYTGKKSRFFGFKSESHTYRWNEVSSIAFNNGLRIITINFTDDEKIKFFAEPDKVQKFYDNVEVYCLDKVESKDQVTTYLQQIPSMEAEYDKSLFRGLSIGMPILFVGIALLLCFVLFMAIRQTH